MELLKIFDLKMETIPLMDAVDRTFKCREFGVGRPRLDRRVRPSLHDAVIGPLTIATVLSATAAA